MLIEGENLEVLRVLQKSYYGKVKTIYIDPPYNTGNDSFVYPDKFAETRDDYQKRTGEKDEQGLLNKQSLWKKNSKDSGHYHSAWLSMMYSRLYLARNLLREDGVVFISIDANEVANLKLLCDEIFGEENLIGDFIIKRSEGGGLARHMIRGHDYLLAYARTISRFSPLLRPKEIRGKKELINNELYWIEEDWLRKEFGKYGTCSYDEIVKYYGQGKKDEIDEGLSNGDYVLIAKNNTQIVGRYRKISEDGSKFYSVIKHLNKNGVQELKSLKLSKYFDYPKPSSLIKQFILGSSFFTKDKNAIVLDFFAGSGTTAHAVMELNAEDGGYRQSISVQLPEVLEEKSEAYKAGYRTIADITRARIDKVIDKLKAEHPEKTKDLACAHFTLAPSNFKVWRSDLSTAEEILSQLELHQRLEKSEANDDEISQNAMLTELLLKNGLGALGVHAISKPKKLLNDLTIHRVLMPDDRQLWICFEPYQDGLKDEIAKAKPARVILLNSCFEGPKADEQISNLQLELESLGIDLVII